MGRVKVLLSVVLCCVVGLLADRGAEIGRNDFGRVNGKSNSSPRGDPNDPTQITMISNVDSALFANCVSQANSAYVTFKELVYPTASYSRYVPSDDASFLGHSSWVTVTDPINSFQDCSDYANQNSAVMFYYDGTACRTSNVLLSTSSPSCGDPAAQAVYVQMSCAPVISDVTVVSVGVMIFGVSWLLRDPCNLVNNVHLNYTWGTNQSGQKDVSVGTSTTNFTLSLGCSNLQVTLTPQGANFPPQPPVTVPGPDYSTKCAAGYDYRCFGCVKLDQAVKNKAAAVDYCNTQIPPPSKLFTVSSVAELANLISYFGTVRAGSVRYWIDLTRTSATDPWIWGRTNFPQETSSSDWKEAPSQSYMRCATLGKDLENKLFGEDCSSTTEDSHSRLAACFYIPAP